MITKKEDAIIATGSLAFSEAAQMLLAKHAQCGKDRLAANFVGEPKKYYSIFSEGIKKALFGLDKLNEKQEARFCELGDAKASDNVRKIANDMIRLYFILRNYARTEEEKEKFFRCLADMCKGKSPIVSHELIDQYRIDVRR